MYLIKKRHVQARKAQKSPRTYFHWGPLLRIMTEIQSTINICYYLTMSMVTIIKSKKILTLRQNLFPKR